MLPVVIHIGGAAARKRTVLWFSISFFCNKRQRDRPNLVRSLFWAKGNDFILCFNLGKIL